MNGLDFFLRVLKPWARDPGFYQTVFAEMSDVPAHEGPSAEPNIDLCKYSWPLTHGRRRQADRAARRGPGAARRREGQPRRQPGARSVGLWRSRFQRAGRSAGSARGRHAEPERPWRTTHRSLGRRIAALKRGGRQARVPRPSEFAAWIKSEAPRRTGPSGVGKDNYNWYLKNVLLSPLRFRSAAGRCCSASSTARWPRCGWRKCATAPRRRSPKSAIPPPIASMAEARNERLYRLLVDAGFIADKPYYRSALFGQLGDYTPPAERNFFTHVTALDPLPLSSHQFHWIELARLRARAAPQPDPRHAAACSTSTPTARKGFATAMEEVLMQAGLYDDEPHGRELVWAMLANRAARGLASLRVQANEIGLDEAGKFHAAWTPRGWSDASSRLVGFEQLLYLRQPGYGPSYIVGKAAARPSARRSPRIAPKSNGRPFSLARDLRRDLGLGHRPAGDHRGRVARPTQARQLGALPALIDRRWPGSSSSSAAASRPTRSLELVRLLKKAGHQVTPGADQGRRAFRHRDEPRHAGRKRRFTPRLWDLKDEVEIGHIQLAASADFILVCPATADLLAKMAAGICRRPRDDPAARHRQAGGGRPGDERPHVATRRDAAQRRAAEGRWRASHRARRRRHGVRRIRPRPPARTAATSWTS